MYDLIGLSDLHDPRLPPYPIHTFRLTPLPPAIHSFLVRSLVIRSVAYHSFLFGTVPHVLYTYIERVENERRTVKLSTNAA